MRNTPTAIVAAAAALSACASHPESPESAALTTPQAVQTEVVAVKVAPDDGKDANDLVCKPVATIGTRLTRRVCKTRAQIEWEQQVARSETERMQGLMMGPDPSRPRDFGKLGQPGK